MSDERSAGRREMLAEVLEWLKAGPQPDSDWTADWCEAEGFARVIAERFEADRLPSSTEEADRASS